MVDICDFTHGSFIHTHPCTCLLNIWHMCSLVSMFVSGMYMVVTCEADVEVDHFGTYVCTNDRSI